MHYASERMFLKKTRQKFLCAVGPDEQPPGSFTKQVTTSDSYKEYGCCEKATIYFIRKLQRFYHHSATGWIMMVCIWKVTFTQEPWEHIFSNNSHKV